MKKTAVLLSVVIGLSLAACGEDIPSESQGKKVLTDKYEKSECLKLVDFKKTNGQKSDFGGVLEYKMEYSAALEMKNGCHGYVDKQGERFVNPPDKIRSEQGDKNMKALGFKLVNGGEQASIIGIIAFSKKENGWEGHDLVF
jgi:hypothetical protein